MPRELCWYVALAQLPGTSPRLQEACHEAMMEVLRRLPVASRRHHAWAGLRADPESASAQAEEAVPPAEALSAPA